MNNVASQMLSSMIQKTKIYDANNLGVASLTRPPRGAAPDLNHISA
jgi:hypothetical protein